MDSTTWAFLILAVVAAVSAFRVVTAPRIMHAALWMGAAFIAVAGVFLVLNAEFLAAAQVLIYVGAVTTIIIFGIMLSEPGEIKDKDNAAASQPPAASAGWRRGVLPLLAAVVLAVVMISVYWRSGWSRMTPSELLADNTRSLGLEMFTDFVLPFELAAILLLVALVGAIVMATKEAGK